MLFGLLLVTTHALKAQDSWAQKASLLSPVNTGSYGCSIGNKGYVIPGGSPGSYFENAPKNDFWEYDPVADTWTKKANTPEPLLNYGLAFSLNGKGYFGLSGGIWEYDPSIDTWTKKLTLPAGISNFPLGFSIAGKAYFGWGSGNDFWEYDPLTGNWLQKANFPGTVAASNFDPHTGFSIGNKGYVPSKGQNIVNTNDFWEYNPATDSWTQKASFGGSIRIGSTGFGLAGKGYVATSLSVVPTLPYTEMHIWEYSPTLDSWTEKAPFGGNPRGYALNFTIGNKGYMGFGVISFRTGAAAANDLWEYTPSTTATPPVNTGNGAGLKGVYFNGITLSGAPLLTRIDSTINFNFSYGNQPQVLSPAPGVVPEDRYSVRWTGLVQPQYSETYTFSTVSDDGIRLWVNGVLLIDNRVNQSATEKSGSIALIAGNKYDIKIEYFENTGDAVTQLYWSSASTPRTIVPKSQLYTPPAAPGTGTGLQGIYFNGTTLSGTPLLTRIDSNINFNLSYGNQPQVLSPAPGIVPEDGYSVRWTGLVQPLYSETYTFSTVSDDGIRLWVNGVLLVDNWVNQSATEKSGSITLVGGEQYKIVVEYFENTGNAVTQLYWTSASTPKAIIPKSQLYPPATGIGLQGTYYKGTQLSGVPLLTRIDPTINFDLSYGKQPQVLSPAPGIVPEDMFSVRWTGQVQPLYSENYTFYTLSDDGVRLWLNGVLLVNNWTNQSATEKSGSITLVAGQKYDIVLEYFENTGDAVTKLYWSSASTAKEIIPQLQLFPPVASGARTIAPAAITTAAGTEIAGMHTGISPNPVQAGQPVLLTINSNETMQAMLTITSVNGTNISNRRIGLARGTNSITIGTNGLSRGLFIVSITGIHISQTLKLLVQ